MSDPADKPVAAQAAGPSKPKTQRELRVESFLAAFGPACDFFGHVFIFTALAAAIYGLGALLSIAIHDMAPHVPDPWFVALGTIVDRGLLIVDSVFFSVVVLVSIVKMVKEYFHAK